MKLLVCLLFLFCSCAGDSTDITGSKKIAKDQKEILFLTTLYIAYPQIVRDSYNHPKELLGRWSGSQSSTTYCSSYWNLDFSDTSYKWLTKARYYDPFPSLLPCRYSIDYSYGKNGYYYLDWKVEGTKLCEKLFDNSVSEWRCSDYSISSNTLKWDGSVYKK